MAPKTGSKKPVETWRPERDLDCTRNKVGQQREKKHVLTLTLMLVRRKICLQNLCGQQQNSSIADPTFGSKSGSQKRGPKQRPKRRNENVIQFWTPFWGPYLDPKNGVSHRRFSLLPAHVVQADLRPCSLNMNVNSYLFLFVRPKSGCYCQGPFIAAMF